MIGERNLRLTPRPPIVSVILIFKDAERFLPEAIASVLGQTFGDWELILVDDGSADRSTTLARAAASEHPERVRYVAHPGHANLGMSASRNLGIREARGEFISLIDADDVWLPRKLEEQLALLRATPDATFLVAPARWWYGWTGKLADRKQDFVQDFHLPAGAIAAPPSLLLSFLGDPLASICDLLVPRRVVEAVGGYEPEFRGMYEDQVFHAKLCVRYPALIAGGTGYLYRQHPDSCVRQAERAGEMDTTRARFLDWLEDYLEQNRINHPALSQAVARELAPYRHPRWVALRRWTKRAGKAAASPFFRLARRVLPPRTHLVLSRLWHDRRWPPVGWVRMGMLRRLQPISRCSGFDRGRPVDRFFIEAFLERYQADIQGRVLEIADDTYTIRFGGDRVTESEVLHSPLGVPGPRVTVVDDLTTGARLESNSFDCVVLTQTLLLIYDVRAAIRTIHRILKPGGVALVTVPGITPVIREAAATWGQYWSFTEESLARLFAEVFPSSGLTVASWGNVLAATAYLYGLAVEDLTAEELQYHDPDYPVIVSVRACKPTVP
jgi:glycosyltransferase involved in cell wall biosynthesis